MSMALLNTQNSVQVLSLIWWGREWYSAIPAYITKFQNGVSWCEKAQRRILPCVL